MKFHYYKIYSFSIPSKNDGSFDEDDEFLRDVNFPEESSKTIKNASYKIPRKNGPTNVHSK